MMSAGVRRHSKEAPQLAAIWPNKNPAGLIGNPPALISGHRRVRPVTATHPGNPNTWSGTADPSVLATQRVEGAFRGDGPTTKKARRKGPQRANSGSGIVGR
jgi:hypothetical protein